MKVTTEILLSEALETRSGTAFRRIPSGTVSVTRKSNGDWPESINWRHNDKDIAEHDAARLLENQDGGGL